MAKLERMINRDLDKVTVIGSVLQVLHGHIQSAPNPRDFEGVPIGDIRRGFDQIAERIGQRQFFATYVQRHTKHGDYFIERPGNRYSLRPELLDGVEVAGMEKLAEDIRTHWAEESGIKAQQLHAFDKVEALPADDVAGREAFIIDQLTAPRGNAGQSLEIFSFAILSTYMHALGFSLRRFSTTFANDGGMDFIAENGFYQVTATPTLKKIEADCRKLPGASRVLVAPQFDDKVFGRLPKTVLETIDQEDMKNHFLTWLSRKDKRRKKAVLLQEVLAVARQEYMRE